jgi:hypothetical protein
VKACFKVALHSKDLALIKQIQSFFGVGSISRDKRDNQAVFSVSSVKDLINVIIPHFDKYPLITQKRADFLLFKWIVEMINRKEHLTEEGLRKIASIKAAMNLGLSEKLKVAFPNSIPVSRPKVEDQPIKNPH